MPFIAKQLQTLRWDPTTGAFEVTSLHQWLDGPNHLMTTLLITGSGGRGKSRLMHSLAQELCIAYGKSSYIYGKSIDALGILSYAGEVRKAAVLMLTDFDLKIARGGALGSEALKSILDVVEGGSVQDTRYRPAVFPPSLPRIIAVNENEDTAGEWFTHNGQVGIGMLMQELTDKTKDGNPLTRAATVLKTLSADDQAAVRRVSIAMCVGDESLIREETRTRLMEDTMARAAVALARREAFWKVEHSVA